jgi:hypothetical protein
MVRGQVKDGKELTRCAAARNSTHYIALLADIEAANPRGDLSLITDNLVSPQQCPDPCLAG